MAVIDFGGVAEEVITRDEFPVSKALEVLKDERNLEAGKNAKEEPRE